MSEGIGEAVASAMITLVVIAFCAGGFLVWFVPILWNWIKPFIHGITA